MVYRQAIWGPSNDSAILLSMTFAAGWRFDLMLSSKHLIMSVEEVQSLQRNFPLQNMFVQTFVGHQCSSAALAPSGM